MKEIEVLAHVLNKFAGLTEEDFKLSLPYWQYKEYKKGVYYNQYKTVCEHIGFISDGVFRSYVVNAENGKEKNVFLFSKNQFVIPFKSFILQVPCNYYTQAMADSKLLCISRKDLFNLYSKSHNWERFGRLMAQEAFNVAIERTESFVFRTPEERYLDLIKSHPDIFNTIPLYHISSYLGIEGPSLSRIRKRISGK